MHSLCGSAQEFLVNALLSTGFWFLKAEEVIFASRGLAVLVLGWLASLLLPRP